MKKILSKLKKIARKSDEKISKLMKITRKSDEKYYLNSWK